MQKIRQAFFVFVLGAGFGISLGLMLLVFAPVAGKAGLQGHAVIIPVAVGREAPLLASPPSPAQYDPVPFHRIDFIACNYTVLHSGPADFYPVIGQLAAGQEVQIEEWGRGAGAGWARLGTLDGGIRWVDGKGLCP